MILVLFLVLTIGVGLFVYSDKKRYDSGQQSKFFGSKDVYAQNESLYFDDIKVTVSEVEHKRISDIERDSCAVSKFKNMGFGNFEVSQESAEELSSECMTRYNKNQNYKKLVVHLFFENISNKPISLKDYSFKIEGSEDIEGNNLNPSMEGLLAEQSQYGNFDLIVPMSSDVFALTVEKLGQKKQINLSLPEIIEQ